MFQKYPKIFNKLVGNVCKKSVKCSALYKFANMKNYRGIYLVHRYFRTTVSDLEFT